MILFGSPKVFANVELEKLALSSGCGSAGHLTNPSNPLIWETADLEE